MGGRFSYHFNDGGGLFCENGRGYAVLFLKNAGEVVGILETDKRGNLLDGMFFQKGLAFFQSQIIYVGSDSLIEFVFEVHEQGRTAVMEDAAQVCDGDVFAVMFVDIFEDGVEILLRA